MNATRNLILSLSAEGKRDVAIACCDGWIDELKREADRLKNRPSKANIVDELKDRLLEARALKRQLTRES